MENRLALKCMVPTTRSPLFTASGSGRSNLACLDYQYTIIFLFTERHDILPMCTHSYMSDIIIQQDQITYHLVQSIKSPVTHPLVQVVSVPDSVDSINSAKAILPVDP
jgi:hypothetical protein